jgi:hypothetical protein
MTGYVPDESVDHLEDVTDDQTIGLLTFAQGREPDQDGEVKVDINRLRQALISYEENYGRGQDSVYIQNVTAESGMPLTLLRPTEDSAQVVALAGLLDPADDRQEEVEA